MTALTLCPDHPEISVMCSGSNHLLVAVILASLSCCVLCLTGCAGASEEIRQEHELSDAEFRQKFIEDRDRCQSQGRTIVLSGDGAGLDRHGIPRGRANYYCTRIKNFD